MEEKALRNEEVRIEDTALGQRVRHRCGLEPARWGPQGRGHAQGEWSQQRRESANESLAGAHDEPKEGELAERKEREGSRATYTGTS